MLGLWAKMSCLENDSPSRGRKLKGHTDDVHHGPGGLENDSPSRGRKLATVLVASLKSASSTSLENDSPSRGRKHPKGGNENGKYQ